MFDALNIAASGLDAAGTVVSLAANNLANMNMPGYPPQAADLIEISAAGDGVVVEQILPNPRPIVQTENESPGSAVDPVAQAIDLRRAQVLYAANAAVVSAQEQMFGNLIDILDSQVSQPPDTTGDNVQ